MVEYQFCRIAGVYKWFTSTNGVSIGIEPIISGKDVVRRSEGELIQGAKVYTENGVYHRHYDGTVVLYPSTEFYYAPHTNTRYSSLPLRLMFRKPGGELRDTGMCRAAHDGVVRTWKHPDGFYIGARFNGYILQILSGYLYQEFRFISNYLTAFATSHYPTLDISKENVVADYLSASSHYGYDPEEPAAWGSKLPTELNIVGDSSSSVMPYVLPDWPVKDRYPYLANEIELWSDLTKTAVDSLDTIDINSISFLKELYEWKRLLPPIPKTKKDLKKPKTWANFYLWLRYGLGLTIQDSKEIIQGLPKLKKAYDEVRKSKKTRIRSSSHIEVRWNDETWRCRLGLRIILDTYPEFAREFGHFADDLNTLDLYPNLANLWDLIPFSFVVDWFIPVQRWLEKIDSTIRTMNFQIYCVTQSTKWSRTVPPPYVPGYVTSSNLEEVHYIRNVGLDLPHPVLTWSNRDNQTGTNTTFWKRIVDGAALFLQRGK